MNEIKPADPCEDARDYSTPGPWRPEGDEIVGCDGYRIAKMIAWEDAGKCQEGQHNLRRILAAGITVPVFKLTALDSCLKAETLREAADRAVKWYMDGLRRGEDDWYDGNADRLRAAILADEPKETKI
jgi:hypothetical protein